MPKSLAIRGKFVFDPEHGGGRRRRDKHMPRHKIFTENTDKICYNNKDLNKRFEMNDLSDDEEDNYQVNPFAMAQPTDRSQTGAQEFTEVNFLASAGTGECDHPENIEDEDQEEELEIAPELYYSQDGEAHQLPCSESAHSDYGLQNSITIETMDMLLNHKAMCENQGTPMPNIMIIDCRFAYEFEGGHIDGAINVSTREEM